MGTYPASDGQINLAAPTQRMWESLCTVLSADALFADPRFLTAKDRATERDEVKAAIAHVTQEFSINDLVERLNSVGVPCGPINSIGDAFEDPQVKHLGMVVPAPHPELGDINLVRSPINLSRHPHPEAFDSAAPDPGQHSDAVLESFGFSDEEIAMLKRAEAI